MKLNCLPQYKLSLNAMGRIALAVCFSAFLNTAFGQEADTDEVDEVFELNPFIVSAQETGWYATQTLSGSRLRTNFDDVASQIEVLTMEFMDEFGVNSIEEAAIYSINAENSME
jgi:hypothetical protein